MPLPRASSRITQSRAVVSSTMFQMLLYFNVWFFAACFFTQCLLLRWKHVKDPGWRNDYVGPIIFALWSLVEVVRLVLGYAGNLREEVPHLAAFLFLTVFPQAILQLWFGLMQKPLLIVDRIFVYVYVVFIVLELIVGYPAARRIVASKTARFAVEYGAQDAGVQQRASISRARGFGAGLSGVPLAAYPEPGEGATTAVRRGSGVTTVPSTSTSSLWRR